VPELQRLGIDDWRELVITPYRVIYTVASDAVEIDAVIDSRRDIEGILMRRLVGRDKS
jgi:plasmid stabilization system protein ParE